MEDQAAAKEAAAAKESGGKDGVSKANPLQECKQLLKQAAIVDAEVSKGDASAEKITSAIDLYTKFLCKVDMATSSLGKRSQADADAVSSIQEKTELVKARVELLASMQREEKRRVSAAEQASVEAKKVEAAAAKERAEVEATAVRAEAERLEAVAAKEQAEAQAQAVLVEAEAAAASKLQAAELRAAEVAAAADEKLSAAEAALAAAGRGSAGAFRHRRLTEMHSLSNFTSAQSREAAGSACRSRTPPHPPLESHAICQGRPIKRQSAYIHH